MTSKNRTLEGKNRTLGGRGGQNSSKIFGRHLCMFPNLKKKDGLTHVGFWLVLFLQIPTRQNAANDITSIT